MRSSLLLLRWPGQPELTITSFRWLEWKAQGEDMHSSSTYVPIKSDCKQCRLGGQESYFGQAAWHPSPNVATEVRSLYSDYTIRDRSILAYENPPNENYVLLLRPPNRKPTVPRLQGS